MNTKTPTAGSPWRTVLLVVIVAAADFLLSIMNLGISLESGSVPAEPDAAEYVRYAGLPVLAPLGAVALIWRERFPKSVALAAAALGALSFSGIAFLVALYLLARRGLDGWVVAVIALSIGAEALVGVEPIGWEGALVGVVLLAAIAAWGAYRGQRARFTESRLSSLRERAERAESERNAETERSKLAERHRIAREMHDTLAHRMSLVAVQAASLQVDAPDAETAAAAKLIRETAHAALGELRDVLGVLHEDGNPGTARGWETAMSPPSRMAPPGIAQIEGLLAEWRQAGIAVDHAPNTALAEAGAVPDAVSRAAYRVVQEGVTNVARHAPGATAVVTLGLQEPESAGCSLRIMVANGPGGEGEAAVGAGLGLIGLAERVLLLGGTLEHGCVDTGYRLLADIPCERREDNWQDNGVPA
ncbi:histidine kinase [Arthrobacter sp. H35-D1]|uniref:sensor histidine kinase n=1 Tax=Arthrobacter sp. H35-D1 TaxID=3046202 RepID=UPI0024BAD447|nr:histidine kinase [Arthrobacter sp. H35-D1]MDJ0314962.1 histidine kinase [Arthrobacter sp. H35-D1]